MYGSKGWEQIPNIGFWKSCGSLQAVSDLEGIHWNFNAYDLNYY